MAEHTPLPWRNKPNQLRVTAGGDAEAVTVANVWSGPSAPSRAVARANAALIVLAVNAYADMLAALHAVKSQGCHGELAGGISVSYLVDKAIAKAEGME